MEFTEQQTQPTSLKNCTMCGQSMAITYDFCGRCGHELADPNESGSIQKRYALGTYFKEFIFDLLIPFLVGLKTTWLIFVKPTEFCRTIFFQDKPADDINFPLTRFWKRISDAPQYVFQAGQYWFFVLAVMALASILLRSGGLLELNDDQVDDGSPEFARGNIFFTTLRPIISRIVDNYGISDDLLEIPFELLYIVFIFFSIALLASIYHRLIGKDNLPSNHNYTFWLYLVGAQFVGVRVVLILFSIFMQTDTETGLMIIRLARNLTAIGIMSVGLGYLFLVFPIYMPVFVLSKLFNTISFGRALRVTITTYIIYAAIMGVLYFAMSSVANLPTLFGG